MMPCGAQVVNDAGTSNSDFLNGAAPADRHAEQYWSFSTRWFVFDTAPASHVGTITPVRGRHGGHHPHAAGRHDP
jgi:hypothetical protein